MIRIASALARGWIIITRDFAIKRRPNEREAWNTANATVIMVRGEKLSADDMSKLLLSPCTRTARQLHRQTDATP